MNGVLDKRVKSIWYAEEGFHQVLKFSYHKERMLPNGVKSLYSFSRRVQIRYVGLRDELYKFQLGTIRSEFSLSRMAEPTADLSKSLHRALGLLVLGADKTGKLVKIYNLPYVQYRWEELKKEFLQDYDRDEYLVLIQEMDQRITDGNRLLTYLQLPIMYGLYFNGYWEATNTEQIPIVKQKDFGKELSELQIHEACTYSTKKNETQVEVIFNAELNGSNSDITIQGYNSTCTYIDGILDTCKKEIQLGSTKFYYSAKWVGLKKLFQ